MSRAREVPDATNGDSPDAADAAYAAALASVPGIGPKSLRTLLADADPRAAWEALVGGRARHGLPRWAEAMRAARSTDVTAVWAAHCQAGISVVLLGGPGYPVALAADPEAPAVLFCLGDSTVLDGRPTVAIVGTRSATRYGLGVAAQLGADLAAVGVVVASGLALGVDGAAHEGALAAWRAGVSDLGDTREADVRGTPPSRHLSGPSVRAAPPVAVVAGGLDAPYPRQHAGLWRRVAQSGAVFSETPIGSADLAWRFPQRNRIIAAMADVVVVVECHSSGGSMHTVQAAARRGVPVGAVPGSIRSPASAGTNSLLADGCFVVRDASDVLVAVGLATVSGGSGTRIAAGRVAAGVSAETPGKRVGGLSPGTARTMSVDVSADTSTVQETGETARSVLDALGWERCSVDQLMRRTGLALDVLSAALEQLRASGQVVGAGGSWERSER